jgi:polynucleotide 5'-kinase involved in rRNA processing
VEQHDRIIERVAAVRGTVVMLGGLDSGKTTLGRRIARAAVEAGRIVAFLDSDLGQSTVGPPSTVGLKLCRDVADLETERLAQADGLYFVGSTSPQGNLLPLVSGTALLLRRAQEAGAELVILDTTGMVSGVYGQLLKFHKLELTHPDVVIGLERGEELQPLIGIISRFFAAEVLSVPVDPDVVPTSAEQRAANREGSMARYFREPLQRWRVKPTVFMPALPALFELSDLNGLVVGMSDGKGTYIGIGYLEHSPGDEVLRLVSPAAEAPKALKLGSLRLVDGFRLRRVDLRGLFGTD